MIPLLRASSAQCENSVQGLDPAGKLTFTCKKPYIFHQIISQSRCQTTGASIRGGTGGNAWRWGGLGSAETSRERAPPPTAETTGITKLPTSKHGGRGRHLPPATLLPRGPPRAAPCPAERRGPGTSAGQGTALAGCPSRPAPSRPPGPALTVQAGEAQRPLGSSRPPVRLKGPAPPSSARGGRGDSSPVPGAGRAGTPFTASACK